jgi:hypothetical protein
VSSNSIRYKSQNITSFKEISKLSNEGYPSLPEKLENKQISKKVLNVLIYHFYFNNIGAVPMFHTNQNYPTVKDHFDNTTLTALFR